MKKAFTMQLKQCMCVWSVYTSIQTSVNYQLFGKQNCVLQGTFLIIFAFFTVLICMHVLSDITGEEHILLLLLSL